MKDEIKEGIYQLLTEILIIKEKLEEAKSQYKFENLDRDKFLISFIVLGETGN
ncbi:hypothetical protein [Brassicibacter mesophilus]|uniref:hypothetical protein n=1 Tax=Brassicibacter mesophilus TaxID=745119 RepID=UPI003D1E873E